MFDIDLGFIFLAIKQTFYDKMSILLEHKLLIKILIKFFKFNIINSNTSKSQKIDNILVKLLYSHLQDKNGK